MTPSARREAVRVMTQEHALTIKRACEVARLSRAAYYRPVRSDQERDREVIDALNEVVEREIEVAIGQQQTDRATHRIADGDDGTEAEMTHQCRGVVHT